MKHCLTVAAVIGIALIAAQPAHAQEKIRLAYPIAVHEANMVVLNDYAAKHGLNIEVTVMRRYADLQLALMTNQVDAVALGYVNVGLMEEKDFTDYRVVAGNFTGGQSLTLRKGIKATKWKDLEGLKIATAPNSYIEILFKSTAEENGADLSKIKTISFAAGGPPMLAALQSGEIDGFASWEPNNAQAEVDGYGYYSSLDVAANPTHNVNGNLIVNNTFLKTHRAAVVTLVRSLVEATDALNANKAKFAEVATKITGANPAVVKVAMAHGKLDYKLYYNETVALLKLIHKAGITKTDTSSSVARQFDYSVLEEVTGKSEKQLGGR